MTLSDAVDGRNLRNVQPGHEIAPDCRQAHSATAARDEHVFAAEGPCKPSSDVQAKQAGEGMALREIFWFRHVHLAVSARIAVPLGKLERGLNADHLGDGLS